MKALFAAIAVAALVSGPAAADHESEYRAYMAALDAGDIATALELGEAAWRAAETQLGDTPTGQCRLLLCKSRGVLRSAKSDHRL